VGGGGTWFDEASLKLRGTMNRHKSVHSYPGIFKFRRFMRKNLLPGLFFLTAWRGISSRGVTGSSRFQGIFIDPAYLNTLRTFTVPAVGQQYEDEEFYFLQDGATQPYHRHLAENISSGR